MGDVDMPTLSSSVGDLRSSIMRLKISLGPNKAIPLVHVERVRSMRAMLQTLVDASRGGNWVHSAMANDFVRGLQALEELEKLEGAEGGMGYEDEDEEGGYGGGAYEGGGFMGRSYGRGSRSGGSNAVTDALLMAQHSLALLVVHYSNSLQKELSSCQERLAQAEAALSQVQTDKSELLARYAAQGTQLSELMEMESLLSGALSSSQAMVASLTGTSTPRSIGEGGTTLKTFGGYMPASIPTTPRLSPIPLSAHSIAAQSDAAQIHAAAQIDAAHNTTAQFDAAAVSPNPLLSHTPTPTQNAAEQSESADHAHTSPTRTLHSCALERQCASSYVEQGSSKPSSPCCQSAPLRTGVADATYFHHHRDLQQQEQEDHDFNTLSCNLCRGTLVAGRPQGAPIVEQSNAAGTVNTVGAHENEGQHHDHHHQQQQQQQQQAQEQEQEQGHQGSSPLSSPPPPRPATQITGTESGMGASAAETEKPSAHTTAAEVETPPAPTTAAQAASAPVHVLRPLAIFSIPAEKAADSILARTAKGVAPSPQQDSSSAASLPAAATQQGNLRVGGRGLDPVVSCVSGRELRLLRLLLGVVQLDRCLGQVLHGSWGIICAAWSMAWNSSQLVAGAVWPWTLLRRFL